LLASFQLPDLTPGEPVTLSSGVAFGPLATDAGVLLVTDADGLLCLDAELKTKWKTPLDGAGVVATSAVASDLLVVTSRGALVRIDAAGKVVKRLETNRPLGGEPLLVGQDLWCPGADGAVYVVPLTELAE
jgi:hypothetical protein